MAHSSDLDVQLGVRKSVGLRASQGAYGSLYS